MSRPLPFYGCDYCGIGESPRMRKSGSPFKLDQEDHIDS